MCVFECVHISNLFLGSVQGVCVCERVNNRFSTMHASLDAVTLNELSLAHLHTNTFLITSRHTWYVPT